MKTGEEIRYLKYTICVHQLDNIIAYEDLYAEWKQQEINFDYKSFNLIFKVSEILFYLSYYFNLGKIRIHLDTLKIE